MTLDGSNLESTFLYCDNKVYLNLQKYGPRPQLLQFKVHEKNMMCTVEKFRGRLTDRRAKATKGQNSQIALALCTLW